MKALLRFVLTENGNERFIQVIGMNVNDCYCKVKNFYSGRDVYLEEYAREIAEDSRGSGIFQDHDSRIKPVAESVTDNNIQHQSTVSSNQQNS